MFDSLADIMRQRCDRVQIVAIKLFDRDPKQVIRIDRAHESLEVADGHDESMRHWNTSVRQFAKTCAFAADRLSIVHTDLGERVHGTCIRFCR